MRYRHKGDKHDHSLIQLQMKVESIVLSRLCQSHSHQENSDITRRRRQTNHLQHVLSLVCRSKCVRHRRSVTKARRHSLRLAQTTEIRDHLVGDVAD